MKNLFGTMVLAFFILSPAFAGGEKPVAGGMKKVLLKSSSSWEGIELPEYNRGKPEVVILKNVVMPGVKIPLHTHTVISAGVLLSGELTVISEDNEKIVLKEGDALIEAVGKYYSAVNEGSEPAVILAFFASVQGEPLIVER